MGLKPVENVLAIPTKGLVPDRVDRFFAHPTLFTWIVIFQALFGGNGLPYTPSFIKTLAKKSWFRLCFIVLIGYSATGDFETSLGASCLLLLFLHFMKTPKELRDHPNIF